MFNVVLIEPEIPPNTGNVGRLFLTTKAKRGYYEIKFSPGDFLVFGRETKGLAEKLLAANLDNFITIPMHGTRSVNLATAVAIVLFEAVRQKKNKPGDTTAAV